MDININKDNLFLHVCCAPCSSEVLNQLNDKYNIFIIYSNDNIDSLIEFNLRLYEVKKMISKYFSNINIIYSKYNHTEYLIQVAGYENEPEGGKRCKLCFIERFTNAFKIANNYIINNNLTNYKNYICSTLSISPHKDAKLLNNIGNLINKEYKDNLIYLDTDFKKKDGYLKSIKYSKVYNLYRQNYCGCEFAKNHL